MLARTTVILDKNTTQQSLRITDDDIVVVVVVECNMPFSTIWWCTAHCTQFTNAVHNKNVSEGCHSHDNVNVRLLCACVLMLILFVVRIVHRELRWNTRLKWIVTFIRFSFFVSTSAVNGEAREWNKFHLCNSEADQKHIGQMVKYANLLWQKRRIEIVGGWVA